jgi:hypothetical protein
LALNNLPIKISQKEGKMPKTHLQGFVEKFGFSLLEGHLIID